LNVPLKMPNQPPFDRRVLIPAAGGLAGFIVHAFMFFKGVIFYMPLK
jgi:hypothetical protein